MDLRTCGGAHPADTPRQKNKHGFRHGEKHTSQVSGKNVGRNPGHPLQEKVLCLHCAPPNVRDDVDVPDCWTLEGLYGGVLIFLTSSVRCWVATDVLRKVSARRARAGFTVYLS